MILFKATGDFTKSKLLLLLFIFGQPTFATICSNWFNGLLPWKKASYP